MPEQARTENGFAVCVGINDYAPSTFLSSLQCAESDASAMDELLGKLGFPPEHRCLLLGANATLETINKALGTFLLDKPKEHDLVLFYFAGHSEPLSFNDNQKGEVFLAPYDFNSSELKESPYFRRDQALGMDRLRRVFFEGEEGSQKRLFLFDSCYSGDFFGPRYRDGTDSVQGYIQHIFNNKSTGRVALSSCLPHQKAIEYITLGHGQFTYYLLQALGGQAPDAVRPDGWVTVNTLFEYLTKHLPEEQRPVLSGVQHDTFELVYYPHLDLLRSHPSLGNAHHQLDERTRFLKALIIGQQGFIGTRLETFVGRQVDLAKIKQQIAETMSTGGYVIIAGLAGEGKSSIIAKLVEAYNPDKVAHHFIPFHPGPDHQVNILRNLMARLIMKHHLSELYVASDSRAALRGFFPNVLEEIAEKKQQEVIFVDGLDQLEKERDGLRDLSFLPGKLPAGMVFVLGTRPDDTLKSLEIYKPHVEYRLENFSRDDFDLIIQRYQVKVDHGTANQLYQSMQGNALYLNLIARVLDKQGTSSAQEIIASVSEDPENIFTWSIRDLKRPSMEWQEVIKPILGLLLVSREPLSHEQIRQILHIAADRLLDGLERVGGLVAEDGQHNYSLYHLKLQDYLRQDRMRPQKEYIFAREDEHYYHAKVVAWCEQSDLKQIWKDANDLDEQQRRQYARNYYIHHLYHARLWERLFNILDNGTYGRAKVTLDPSGRSYVQDLELGCRAAMHKRWSFEEGIAHLPYLWRYTLLRCSLQSQADRYPLAMFKVLLLLGQEAKVVGLAELLSDRSFQGQVFLLIAQHLLQDPHRQLEARQWLLRVSESVEAIWASRAEGSYFGDSYFKEILLLDLWKTYAYAGLWNSSEGPPRSFHYAKDNVEALIEISQILTQVGEKEKARQLLEEAAHETEMTLIPEQSGIEALSKISQLLIQAGYQEKAGQMLEETARVVEMFWCVEYDVKTSGEISHRLIQAGKQEKVVQMLEENAHRSAQMNHTQPEALGKISHLLVQAGYREKAVQLLEETARVAEMFSSTWSKAKALGEIGWLLVQVGHHEKAEQIFEEAALVARQILEKVEQAAGKINDAWERANTLSEISEFLVQAGLVEEAVRVARKINDAWKRAKTLDKVSQHLLQVDKKEKAGQILEEAALVASEIEHVDARVETLSKISQILAQLGLFEEAVRIAREIDDADKKAVALSEIGWCLGQVGHQEKAEQILEEAARVAGQIEKAPGRAIILRKVGQRLVQIGTEKKAGQILEEAARAAGQLEYPWMEVKRSSLSEICRYLTQTGLFEKAVQIAKQMSDANDQAKALKEISQFLGQTGRFEKAILVAREIKHVGTRAEILSKISQLLAQASRFEEAIQIAREIDDADKKAVALSEIGWCLGQVGHQEKAEQILEEAEQVIRKINNAETGAKALNGNRPLVRTWVSKMTKSEVSHFLFQAGNDKKAEQVLEKAEQAARQIQGAWQRAEALIEIGHFLFQAGNDKKAEQVLEKAEQAAEEIEKEEYRAELLIEISQCLAQAGKKEKAERVLRIVIDIAEDIPEHEDPDDRAEALLVIIRGLVLAGWFKEAERVTQVIEYRARKSKAWALQEISRCLAEAGQFEEAERVANQIKETTHKMEALINIAKYLSSSTAHEKFLPFLYPLLLSAKTREDARALLPVIFPAVHFLPDIDTFFYEAFHWVDNFL